jgi:hypothetical protein
MFPAHGDQIYTYCCHYRYYYYYIIHCRFVPEGNFAYDFFVGFGAPGTCLSLWVYTGMQAIFAFDGGHIALHMISWSLCMKTLA